MMVGKISDLRFDQKHLVVLSEVDRGLRWMAMNFVFCQQECGDDEDSYN
jgi:hypothetical protein